METFVCPQRELAEGDGDAMETVHWWLTSSPFNGLSGAPSGPPEWPRPGGYFHQDGKVLDAVDVLRDEWRYLPMNEKKPSEKKPDKPTRRRS